MVELRDDRFYFVGRRDGVINVGGLKVCPEEIEAVINRHPAVRAALVKGRRNPITGEIVVAEVVLADAAHDEAALKAEIRRSLPSRSGAAQGPGRPPLRTGAGHDRRRQASTDRRVEVFVS